MFRAHDRDDKKRSQSPPDPASAVSSTDVHIITRDHETMSSHVTVNRPSSSFIATDNRASSMDYQLSAAAVIYCVQPQYSVLSVPSYLLAPAWRAMRWNDVEHCQLSRDVEIANFFSSIICVCSPCVWICDCLLLFRFRHSSPRFLQVLGICQP